MPLPLSGKASNKSSIVRRCAGKCAPTPPFTHTHTKSTFNMRTRSSAKSTAEQGPESTQGLKTAESSQKAPPKAAKPRGRVQGKPKSPPARKDAAKAKARNKSSNVEDVGTETGDATPPASLQDHVAPKGHAGELAKDAAAEKPPLGGSKVAAGPTRARKGKERSKATDDPTNSVIEAHNDLINSVVLHHASGKASEHVTLVSIDVSLQIEGLCPDVLIATERGPALITKIANAISFCAGVAEDFDSSPLGVYATGEAVVLALQAFGNFGLASYPADVPQLLAVAPKFRDDQLIKFSNSQLLPYGQEMQGPLAALDATTLSRPSTIFLSLIVPLPLSGKASNKSSIVRRTGPRRRRRSGRPPPRSCRRGPTKLFRISGERQDVEVGERCLSVERQDVVAERRHQRERREPRPVRVSIQSRVRDHFETNNTSQRRGRPVVGARDDGFIGTVHSRAGDEVEDRHDINRRRREQNDAPPRLSPVNGVADAPEHGQALSI